MNYFISNFFNSLKLVYYYFRIFPIRKKLKHYRFSIVIPCYNRAHIIERAINSIYSQKLINRDQIEIILVDDGSTDNIDKVICKYDRVNFFKIDHIGKIGLVRNIALTKCKNEIICYLDSDDYYKNLHLAILAFNYNKDTDVKYISTRAYHEINRIENGQIKIKKRKCAPYPSYPVTNAQSHKRQCFLELGGFSDNEFGEDVEYWKKLKKNYKSAHIKCRTVVYTFIVGGNNITYKYYDENIITK